jgi:hypothetical protein
MINYAPRSAEATMPLKRRFGFFSLIVICALGFTIVPANAQIPVAGKTYPDAAAGLQSQFADLIRVARSNDRIALQAELDSLGIPNADTWFTTNFDTRFAAKLVQDYVKTISGYQSHMSWVMGNFAKFDDFALGVEPSELPPPLRDSGFESLLARPKDALKIENYRFTSISDNPQHGPPSSVNSFIYIDGRFRFVGGTYPFWTEGLSAFRGPMSLPPAVIDGMIVQGAAYRKDQKGSGIDAVVQLKIEVDRDGRVNHINVRSGDKALAETAKKYLKTADFGAMPNIPQLANAKREWDFEVAFFTPRSQ